KGRKNSCQPKFFQGDEVSSRICADAGAKQEKVIKPLVLAARTVSHLPIHRSSFPLRVRHHRACPGGPSAATRWIAGSARVAPAAGRLLPFQGEGGGG